MAYSPVNRTWSPPGFCFVIGGTASLEVHVYFSVGVGNRLQQHSVLLVSVLEIGFSSMCVLVSVLENRLQQRRCVLVSVLESRLQQRTCVLVSVLGNRLQQRTCVLVSVLENRLQQHVCFSVGVGNRLRQRTCVLVSVLGKRKAHVF